MDRRQFIQISAALATAKAVMFERQRVRLWLANFHRGDVPAVVSRSADTYRDVAAERLVPSYKTGQSLAANNTNRAGNLEPGDALLKRRVRDGESIDFPSQIWIICRVEILS